MPAEHKIRHFCNGVKGPDGKRAGCGFETTTAIEDLPFDGGEHVVKCSFCGNETRVKRLPPGEAAPQ